MSANTPDAQAKPEQFRKWQLFSLAIMLAVFAVVVIVIPLLRGEWPDWSVIAVALPILIALALVSLWVTRRLGVYEFAVQEQRQPGETWRQSYVRRLFAEPSYQPYYKLSLVLGVVILALCLPLLVVAPSSSILVGCVVGLSALVSGGAELLPQGQRRFAAALRILNQMLACINVGLLIAYFRR